MTVQSILNTQQESNTSYIVPDATIAQALESPGFEQAGAVVVSTDGVGIQGILSERDIVRGLKKTGAELLSKQVRDLMTVKVLTCEPNDSAAGIMALMASKHVRHVPVVTDGKMIGMVSVRDLLQLRLQEVLSEAQAMEKYIGGSL